jgi:hypothetical protein
MWDSSHIKGISHLEDSQVTNHRVISLKGTHLLGDTGSQLQRSQ